jgi:phenylpropionate dioxygenase-like ring-hydroxylating dioxygenase large terminal subunit
MTHTALQSLIAQQKPNHSLQQPFYTDPEIFQLEWEKIWRKQWLYAGTTAEIPKSGDFFTYQLQKDSVIVVRGNHGEVYAHHNSCRHRGSLICLEERGNATRLVCPYHQWLYDRDGRLLKARSMPADFKKEDHGLQPVHVRVLQGFIFISLAEVAPDFTQMERDFQPFLSPFMIDDAKVAHRAKYILRTNWKLIAENFRECYHCGPAHPEYCGAVIGADMLESADATLAEKIPLWQQKGLATETVPFVGDSAHFAIRYPLRNGIKSYSLDGKEVAIPMGRHKDYDAGVLGMVVYPNWWMDAVSDYMWTMRLTAINASTTVLDLSWLVDKDAVEGRDYTLDRLIEFWKITGEQDWKLCENNFKGIESSAYRPGPYAPAETDVAEYITWYLGKMGN